MRAASFKKKQSLTSKQPVALPHSSRRPIKQSDYSVKLFDEQKPAVDFVLERDASALFFEQRVGKTFITLSVLEHMPNRDKLAVVLVCILNNKESTWRSRLAELLPWMNVSDDWDEYKSLPFPKLLLVHYETLHTIADKIKRAKWVTFAILDEAHRLKDRGSRQSRAAAKLRYVPKRLILTGTPIEKQPKDLWGQFRFLAEWLFGKWVDFENEFMDFAKIDMEGVKPGTARWKIKIMQQGMLRHRATFRPEKLPKLVEMIKPYAMRLTKVDAGILPPTILRIPVTLGAAQKRLYDRMKKDSVVRLQGGQRVMASLAVTNIIKRRQIASGFVYDDDGECHATGDAKLRKLVALFDRLPKPVVVFACFIPEIDAIRSALRQRGYSIATVTGATRKAKRPMIWRNFQRAQYDGIVCQTRVGGVGVDLWKANYAIAHSISHSSIDFDQMKSRLDAKSKRVAAKIYVLTGRDTIDEDLYDMVVEKGLTSEEVLHQLKKGAR